MISILTKSGLPGRIIRRLSRHPVMVITAASLGIRVGKDAYDFKNGEIDGPEFRARQGSHFGGISGGLAGARVGMVAGSVVPGLGTLLGAFAGGYIGETIGSKLGRKAVEQAEVTLSTDKSDKPKAANGEKSEPAAPPEGAPKDEKEPPKRTL